MLVDIASQWKFILICRSTKQRNQRKLLFNEYIWNHTIMTLIGYCIYIYIIWRPGPGINSSLSPTEKILFPCSFQIKREVNLKICSSFGSILPSHYVQIAGIGNTSKQSRHIFQRNKNPYTKWIWWFNTYSTGRGDLLQILRT